MSGHHLKKLMLLRHAKADWPREVTSDHERPLSGRGHRDAPQAGIWMRENDAVPDFILCSSALRTRQTCTWICEELGDKGHPERITRQQRHCSNLTRGHPDVVLPDIESGGVLVDDLL